MKYVNQSTLFSFLNYSFDYPPANIKSLIFKFSIGVHSADLGQGCGQAFLCTYSFWYSDVVFGISLNWHFQHIISILSLHYYFLFVGFFFLSCDNFVTTTEKPLVTANIKLFFNCCQSCIHNKIIFSFYISP